MSTLGDVLTRYDELAVLLASMDERPAGDDDQARRAAAVLHREARLLDAGRLGAWLATFTDDAVLWVPLAPHAHPGTDQSCTSTTAVDSPSASRGTPTRRPGGSTPLRRCVRSIGTVEAWATADGVVAHSTFTMVEQRKGEVPGPRRPPGPRARRSRHAVPVEDRRRPAAGRSACATRASCCDRRRVTRRRARSEPRPRPPPAVHRPRAVRAGADPGVRRLVVLPGPREPAAGARRLRSPRRSAAGPSSSPAATTAEVRALLNRCRHRGAVVVAGERGLRQAIHLPVPRLDVRRRRPARRAAVPAQPPDRSTRRRRSGSAGWPSASYRGSSSARCTPIRQPVDRLAGSGDRGVRRHRRPPPGRAAAVRPDAAARRVPAATGSCRGTTPPTASTPRSPTAPTTSSGGPPSVDTVLERDPPARR